MLVYEEITFKIKDKAKKKLLLTTYSLGYYMGENPKLGFTSVFT